MTRQLKAKTDTEKLLKQRAECENVSSVPGKTFQREKEIDVMSEFTGMVTGSMFKGVPKKDKLAISGRPKKQEM